MSSRIYTMKEKQNNPRKNKEVYNLWLTKEEEKEIEDILNKKYLMVEPDARILTQRLREIKSRGDFQRR